MAAREEAGEHPRSGVGVPRDGVELGAITRGEYESLRHLASKAREHGGGVRWIERNPLANAERGTVLVQADENELQDGRSGRELVRT